jgi:phage-related protein
MAIIETIHSGIGATISIYKENEDSDSFLPEIEKIYPKDFKQLVTRINRLADFGELKDERKFKHLEAKIYEIKTDLLRILCFYSDGSHKKIIILSNYFKKCSNKKYKREIEKAKNILELIKTTHRI